uniref:Uncharacterized protein n=1 Tax=Schistocephalus solidus TaxID=70667 RepID=A0A0V0J508_SCHSO
MNEAAHANFFEPRYQKFHSNGACSHVYSFISPLPVRCHSASSLIQYCTCLLNIIVYCLPACSQLCSLNSCLRLFNCKGMGLLTSMSRNYHFNACHTTRQTPSDTHSRCVPNIKRWETAGVNEAWYLGVLNET